MRSRGRLIVIDGPTAAGKTTTASALAAIWGRHLVVLERDDLARLTGYPEWPHAADDRQRRTLWMAAARHCEILAKDLLRHGTDVAIVTTLTSERMAALRHRLRSLDPTLVLLLPSWGVNVKRRQQRMRTHGSPKELDLFDWDAHRAFYDDLSAGAEEEVFDVVLDTGRLSPQGAARRLRDLLH